MFTIQLDSHSSIPLYEQIYTHIKEELKNGNLLPYSKLPSARSLASHLQVSRNTIDMAYGQLLSEGYIDAKPKRGYFVNPINDLIIYNTDAPSKTMEAQTKAMQYSYDFSPFAIDITTFPYNTWWKLTKTCLGYGSNDLFLLGESQGDKALRQAIMRYLHESRGVNCSTDQIVIGAGTDYLLQLLLQIMDFTDGIAMENPTYLRAYQIFNGFDIRVSPISLDENGIHMEEMAASNADIVYVTPSHQYPLGIVMPVTRRLELLKWANNKKNRYIIEDDHDSEFRYKGKPIPALQGLDNNEKVIYLGTFSRAIAPAIRISYMVLPKPLLDIYYRDYSYYSSTVSRIDQTIITNFIEEGHFERHLNRIRKIYKNKHDLMLQELRTLEREGIIEIQGDNAGLHLVVSINTIYEEGFIIERAKEQGLKLYGLMKHYINVKDARSCPVILLGYANLSDEQIISGCRCLTDFLRTFSNKNTDIFKR